MLKCLQSAAVWGWLAIGLAACEAQQGSRPEPQVPDPGRPVVAEPTPEPPPSAAPALSGSRWPLTHTNLFVPEGAGPSARVPFVLVLHGLGHSGEAVADQLNLDSLARKRRFAYVAPDGTVDKSDDRFWNGWNACCDFYRLNPDHVYLLRQLLDEVAGHAAIDPKRRYVIGFSNGGFMAHRLACEVPGIAAIASIAGSGPGEGEVCKPPAPVAVLQVHGDADGQIRYAGGPTGGHPSQEKHPGAEEVIAAWAARNGCGSPAEAPTPLDFDPDLPDKETLVTRYPGCRRDAELWRVRGGGHVLGTKWPSFEQVLGFVERYRAD